MDTATAIYHRLEAFAAKHGLVLETRGEVGMGRPCVGFMHGTNYVDYPPVMTLNGNDKEENRLDDTRLTPPHHWVPDAYHKHSCMAVLVRHDSETDAPTDTE